MITNSIKLPFVLNPLFSFHLPLLPLPQPKLICQCSVFQDLLSYHRLCSHHAVSCYLCQSFIEFFTCVINVLKEEDSGRGFDVYWEKQDPL